MEIIENVLSIIGIIICLGICVWAIGVGIECSPFWQDRYNVKVAAQRRKAQDALEAQDKLQRNRKKSELISN